MFENGRIGHNLKGLPWDQNPKARDLHKEASDPGRIVIAQEPQPQHDQQPDPRQFYVTRAHVDDRLYDKTP